MKKIEKSLGKHIEDSALLILVVAPLIVFAVIGVILYCDLKFKYDVSETTLRIFIGIFIFVGAGLEWKFLNYLSKELKL